MIAQVARVHRWRWTMFALGWATGWVVLLAGPLLVGWLHERRSGRSSW